MESGYREAAPPNATPEPLEEKPESVVIQLCTMQGTHGIKHGHRSGWLAIVSVHAYQDLMSEVTSLRRFGSIPLASDEVVIHGPCGAIRVIPRAGQTDRIRMYLEV